jgi:hypothetical protein
MRIKTADAIGPALDWLVAKCEGYDADNSVVLTEWIPDYSTDPTHSWPIIEREIFSFSSDENSDTKYAWHKNGIHRAYGDAFLIAAMRCYCASKLGAEVEIPEELGHYDT